VFQVLNLKWDRPLIDLFTTSLNHELEMYISSIPDQKAWAVTCFIRYFLILEWNLQLHLLPFSSCSQESLNKIQMIGCMTIIIATAYPRQTGFLNLLLLFFFWQISFFFHREWTFSRNLRERSYIRG
jgi:hypothetical protein